MKIEVKRNETKIKEITYPYLAEIDNTIVLFHAYSVGMVVSSNQYEIGHYSAVWAMNLFKPYIGSIILSSD